MALKGTVFITGANGGLGSAFVQNFMNSPQGKEYKGLYAVRNPETAHKLKAILKKAPKDHQYELFAMDQSSLANVRSSAARLNELVSSGAIPPIRALILNAAMQHVNGQTFNEDGFESHFGINYLAQFLFVLLVLQSMDKEHGRIINIGSSSHDPHHWGTADNYPVEVRDSLYNDTEELAYGKVDFENKPAINYKAGMRRYGTSKLLGIIHIYELQRRLNASPTLKNISCVSMDPGAMGDTTLFRESPLPMQWALMVIGFIGKFLRYLLPTGYFRTAAWSASTLMFVTFDTKEMGEHPQAPYMDGDRLILSSKESRDQAKQKKLWEDSVKLAGVKEGDTILENWK